MANSPTDDHFQEKRETSKKWHHTLGNDSTASRKDPKSRTIGGHTNSDAATYQVRAPLRSGAPSRQINSRVKASTISTSSGGRIGRKSESEPGCWSPSMNPARHSVSSRNRQSEYEQAYKKRTQFNQTHARPNRTDGWKSLRNRDPVSSAGSNETSSNQPDPGPRTGSDSLHKQTTRSSGAVSMDNIAAIAKPPTKPSRKHSDDHTQLMEYNFTSSQRKPRPVSMNNLNYEPDAVIVRLLNAPSIYLDHSQNITIGDALWDHVSSNVAPLECVLINTDIHVSWNTMLRDLSRKILSLREISISPSNKKRASGNLENGLAIKHWFEYCMKQHKNAGNAVEQMELRCLMEQFPSCLDDETETIDSCYHAFNLSLSRKRCDACLRQFDIFKKQLDENRDHLFTLEENWAEFVKMDMQSMSTQEQQRQSAIWEVFVTELNYIKNLRATLETYFQPFLLLRGPEFLHLNTSEVFNKLDYLYSLNLRLWFGYLHPAYCEAKATGAPLNVFMLERGFLKIPQLFVPYTDYCLNLEKCQRYIKWLAQNNPYFDEFLKWAESVRSERHQALWDQIAKPFKRITQYNLMLVNIQKYCDDPKERQAIDRMHAGIEQLLNEINENMLQADQRSRMELLQKELQFKECPEKYDVDCKPLFDQYKKISIMEDIVLPPPMIITEPEVLVGLGLDLIKSKERTDQTLNAAPASLRSRHKKSQMYKSESHLHLTNKTENTPTEQANRSSSLKQTTPSRNSSPTGSSTQALPVMLTRFEPTNETGPANPDASILDRSWLSSIPAESRQTVPRRLIRKGELQLRETQGKNTQWTDATCFLLTDQFIIGKSKKRGHQSIVEVVKQPIRLDKLVVQKVNERGLLFCAVLNDFQMIATVHTFHATLTLCEEWFASLEKAKANYLELMKPKLIYASSQGSFPPHWFARRQNSQSPCDRSVKSRQSPTEEQKRHTLLDLANQSPSSQDDESIRKAPPYRRPMQPNIYNPTREMTLSVNDTRARPIQTPLSVPGYSSDGVIRRVGTPSGQAKVTSATVFFPPGCNVSQRLQAGTPIPTVPVRSTPIRSTPIPATPIPSTPGVKPKAGNGGTLRLHREDVTNSLISPATNSSDTNSEFPNEDRVIRIDRRYLSKASSEITQSTPDLNTVSTRNYPHVVNGTNRRMSDISDRQNSLRRPTHPSSVLIIQSKTPVTWTRC